MNSPSPTPTRRQAQAAATRRRILESAWDVTAERGVAGLTTRLVADRAGISHGMCHYHFAGKDDLLLALVEHARVTWITPLERLLAQGDTALERLRSVIAWMAEPAAGEVMRVHLELSAYSARDPALSKSLAGEYERWREAMVFLFRELDSEGAMRPGVATADAARAFAVASDALVWQQTLEPALDSAAIMRAMVAPLLREPL
jgi:AcrR family transcriptional regulator